MQNALFTSLNAAADRMANGAIIVPEFQTEIVDLVRRGGALGQRIQYTPATGSPSRFFEQSDIVDGAFVAPQTLTQSGIDLSGLRTEKALQIKAITSQIGYGLFDMETVGQQGNAWAQLKAKDLKDMVNGIVRADNKALWVGTDTVNGGTIGNSGLQYVGVLKQISKTATIASTASIVDGIRTEVAKLVNDPTIAARPTAIYINPLGLDALEQEIKNTSGGISFVTANTVDVTVGIKVSGIITAAGVLPLIPEPYLTVNAAVGATPVAAATGGQSNYPFAIVTEDLIEYHYVGEKNPRVFQLGVVGDLTEQYVGVKFGAVAVKYPAKAHVVGVIQF
jgi:hypothetical protein